MLRVQGSMFNTSRSILQLLRVQGSVPSPLKLEPFLNNIEREALNFSLNLELFLNNIEPEALNFSLNLEPF
ncbi:MAG: hypothetical protein ACOYN4_16495 [Bacteroidales bacterium]